ncbi:MAG: sensor histidine kinase [Desulfovibrio sp.]
MAAPQCNQSLHFFGKINASISHELKNVFAIMNENAGLLEDLILMQSKGLELTPEKLHYIASKVQNQVQRGNTLLNGMNAFAHSADHPETAVKPIEVIQLMIQLCGRFANMKECTLQTGTIDANPFMTSQFYLEHALYKLIEVALNNASAGTALTIDAIQDGTTITFNIRGLADTGLFSPDEELTALLQNLNAEATAKADALSLRLMS